MLLMLYLFLNRKLLLSKYTWSRFSHSLALALKCVTLPLSAGDTLYFTFVLASKNSQNSAIFMFGGISSSGFSGASPIACIFSTNMRPAYFSLIMGIRWSGLSGILFNSRLSCSSDKGGLNSFKMLLKWPSSYTTIIYPGDLTAVILNRLSFMPHPPFLQREIPAVTAIQVVNPAIFCSSSG